MRLKLGLSALLVLGCGDGGSASGTDPDSTGADESSTDAGSTTTSESGVEESSESSSGTGGLPDYSESPCWGNPAQTLVYNGETHQTDTVDGTCRAEGDRTLLIVQDDLWETAVDQDAVNAFMHRMEIFTPEGSYDPERGVVFNNEDVFGELGAAATPGGKVTIFIVDSGQAGNGYACSWCANPQVHLDGIAIGQLDADFAVSVAAHELYHVIHSARDADESMWVDEAIAEAAMTMNGFFTDVDWLESYIAEPDIDWGPGDPGLGSFNYGGALLFGSYLWERGGPELMRAITDEPQNDWDGLDAALAAVGDDKTAYDLYLDVLVATYLDEPDLGYGFASFDVGDVPRGSIPAGTFRTGSVNPYGVDYFEVTASGDLSMNAIAEGTEPITALAVVMDGDVTVTEIDTATTVSVGRNAEAFIAVTARNTATYEISID